MKEEHRLIRTPVAVESIFQYNAYQNGSSLTQPKSVEPTILTAERAK